MIEQKNDATLDQLVIQLEETILVRVSRATMGRLVQKLKLTRKKNFALLQSKKQMQVQQLQVHYWHEIGEQV